MIKLRKNKIRVGLINMYDMAKYIYLYMKQCDILKYKRL